MNTPKVDVLAAMDAARSSMGMALPGSLEARRSEMAEARAAVAELIEASQKYLEVRGSTHGQPARVRLHAALARIGGDT